MKLRWEEKILAMNLIEIILNHILVVKFKINLKIQTFS